MKIIYFREVGKMLTKKKKILILVGMVALLVVTGCLNLFLNRSNQNVTTSTYESASLLASYRANKKETRQTMMAYYESIISSATDQEQITETNALISSLAARIEEENNLETLIMASGFEDAVVTSTDDGYTVLVKCNGLDEGQVAKILALLVKETGTSATKVKVASV